MAILTKGTAMWVLINNSNGYSLLKIDCPTGITGLGGSKPQIDITCLDDEEMQYVPGMAQPAAISVPINFDPSDPSHLALWDMFDDDTITTYVIGLGKGTVAPTANSGTGIITYPNTRNFISFDGYVADLPVDLAMNTVVKSTLSVQRKGKRTLHRQTA